MPRSSGNLDGSAYFNSPETMKPPEGGAVEPVDVIRVVDEIGEGMVRRRCPRVGGAAEGRFLLTALG